MAMTGGKAYRVRHVKANYGNDNWYIDVYVYVKEKSQDVTNNRTTLSLGMYVATPGTAYDIGAWYKSSDSYLGTATSGTNCKTFDGAIPNFGGTRWIAENKEVTVDHNADGTKTATIYWKWGVNSPWGQCVNPSGSFSHTITTIPRATQPYLNVTSENIGSTLIINMPRASSAFTHTLSYSMGTESGTIGSGFSTSTAWQIPFSLLNAIPNAKSGTCTITCKTYSGSTLIGTKTVSFTATVPDNAATKPTAPTVTLTPVNSVSKFDSLYVQGMSKVRAVISAPTEGKYKATIKSYATSVGGKSKSGKDTTSDFLTTSGTVNVVSTVTDSRGISNSTTKQITVLPYTKPSVIPYDGETMVVCERCAEDGTPSPSGTHLRIKAGRRYSKVESGGTQYNLCSLRFRYKASTSESYSSWITLIAKSSTADTINVSVPDIVTSLTTSYDVQICAIDDVGNSHTMTFTVPTDKVNFHEREGGDGAAFGKYSEKPKALEIADDWELVVYGDRWNQLAYSSSVSASTATDLGRAPYNDAVYYRVENGNHVYIAFNCAFSFAGSKIQINSQLIPEDLRPKREAIAMVSTGGRRIARVIATPDGKVQIDWIQLLASAEETTSITVGWIDGYIDYFIIP